MVTSTLKTILQDSGCTLVIYEQYRLANLKTDLSNQFDVVGLIFQPETISLEVRANAIHEHYNPMTIEIMQQVEMERDADTNETKLQNLLDVCKQIIVRLIASGLFKTILPVTVAKIPERKYDANVIGWTMNLNLYYLKNEVRNPCLDQGAGA